MGGGSKTKFSFYDTGLEYDATKEHLYDLEKQYGINIDRCKAVKSVPLSCKEYGIPFMSKYASEMLQRLQQHDFQWENTEMDKLISKYSKASSAIRWWCNYRPEGSTATQYIIDRNKYLKEFIIKNPPGFRISDKCCRYAKKYTAKAYEKANNFDVVITGVRKSEGGIRSINNVYANCFSHGTDGRDYYRPIFWFTNLDKEKYSDHYSISHSKCYTEYGLKRTGCVGCPFAYMKPGKALEVDVARQFEPKLAKAIENVFGESYEYTRKYMEFREKMKKLE